MVKKTGKIIIALSFFIISILFFSTNVFAIGIYPPQLRLQDAPMGEQREVASMTIVNTDDKPNYFVFKISCLEQTRQNKLRVICTKCNREVGIQRGTLIHPAKIIEIDGLNKTVEYKDGTKQKYNVNASLVNGTEELYTIGEYVLVLVPNDNVVVFKKITATEALLTNGYCPFCGANDSYLIKYDLPPANILSNVTISGKTYAIEPYKETMFRTTEAIPPQQSMDILISVKIPDQKEYYGQHWEARIMATSIPNLDELNGMSMTYGAEAKFLIDTQEWKQEQGTDNGLLFGGIFGFLILIVCIASVVFYRKKVLMPKNGKRKAPILKEGRKIL